MDRLLPQPTAAVDPYDAYRPADPSAPLLRINMVSSLDGHVVDGEGVSGTLGGEGDRAAFVALRHLADAVVAGAGTVRAEGYGPMRVREELAARRAADGRTGPAPVVVVTRSVDLDLSTPLFTDAAASTIVLTTVDADRDRVAAVRGAGGVVVQAGEGDVDLVEGVRRLRQDHGLAHLLVEGGPGLNGQLVAAGLVDEVCLTLSPVLSGGEDPRRAVDGLARRVDLSLSRVVRAGDELLLTYRRP